MTCKEKIKFVFTSKWFSLFMIIVTGWTMIGEDLRLIGPKAIDPLFYTLILLIMMIFVAEIVMSSIYIRKEYFLSIYFWFDI